MESKYNELLLTTIDNPYNPHTDWDRWFDFDVRAGYYTCNYIANVCPNTHGMCEVEEAQLVHQACIDIVDSNGGLYLMVDKDYKPNVNLIDDGDDDDVMDTEQ